RDPERPGRWRRCTAMGPAPRLLRWSDQAVLRIRSRESSNSFADRAGDVNSSPVRPLFTLFMLVALVLAQGNSLANSICRHSSVQAHEAARQSLDSRKAAVAFAEET